MTLPNNIEGLEILLHTIKKNIRHCDYKRTLEIAEDYKIYVTGCNVESKLFQFNPREPKELFEQRKRLTQSITPDMANSIMNPMYKVGRTPATEVVIIQGSDDSAKTQEIILAANKFYGNESVNDYLSYRLPELDSTDPNSFIVVEFSEIVNPLDPNTETANPYPFEVSSKEAINYKFINNQLQFLIVDCPFLEYDDKGKEIILHKYTMYLANYSIVIIEIQKEQVQMKIVDEQLLPFDLVVSEQEITTGQGYFHSMGEKGDKKQRSFIIKQYEHTIPFVPAFRVGSRHDLVTDGRTKVPLMHPAQPYFEKSIKVMSEFDLTIALHTFPQKIQYTDPCLGEGDGEHKVHCLNGFTINGSKCKACNGSGFKYHQSAQDMIQIRMPKDLKDIVSLENIIAYKYPPIDLLEFQKKYGLYELKQAAQTAVYNSEVFSKQEIAQTATAKVIDLDAVYDTLQPFAKKYSDIWVGIMYCIGSLRDAGDKFYASHKFPNDFKMKPFTALLQDLVIANQNNAPSHIKKAITSDITKKIYVDQPQEVVKIETKNKYFPFAGKSESEIVFIISNDLSDNYNKVLYTFFDKIFSDIEYDLSLVNQNFYDLNPTLQRGILDKKVQQYILAIDGQSFAESAVEFGSGENQLSSDAIAAGEQAKANLRGSVGGVQGILQIQQSVVSGITDRESAMAILEVIYGISLSDAERILGEPEQTTTVIPPIV